MDDAPDADLAPQNLEAEQAILGAILFDIALVDGVGDLKASHFREPIHARLYEAIEDRARKGQLAEPAMLIDQFKNDGAFQELGGVRYLADLIDACAALDPCGQLCRLDHRRCAEAGVDPGSR